MACRLTQTTARRSVVPCAGLRVVASAKSAAKPIEKRNDARTAQAMKVAAVATMASTMAGSAQAAQEVSQLASGDNRLAVLATLFVPAIGWVLFNILGPALSQVSDMAEKNESQKKSVLGGLGLAASLLLAGSAEAATQVAEVAASDSRLLVLGTLFVPAVGWVLFNIAGPALNQVSEMAEKNDSRKSIIGGLGLGATLLAAGSAQAASQVAEVAASDSRLLVLGTLFVPAVGWVLFNIAGPALNQVSEMAEKNENQKKSIIGGLGLSASLLAAGSADAASQIADVAASDSRLLVLGTLFVPAVGWVLFNIAGPALNQVSEMAEKNENQKKSIIGGLGLAASLLLAGSADAASQVAEVAASDSRLLVLGTLFVPAVGWVLFNIAGPALNQVSDMAEKNEKNQ